jgi:hypothetical protein
VAEEVNIDHMAVEVEGDSGDYLAIGINGDIKSSAFLLYNTHSVPRHCILQSGEPLLGEMEPRLEPPPDSCRGVVPFDPPRDFKTHTAVLQVEYSQGAEPKKVNLMQLKRELDPKTLQATHPLQNIWIDPFFYEDSRHIFFIRTIKIATWPSLIWLNPGAHHVPKGLLEIPPLISKVDPKLNFTPTLWISGRPIDSDPGVVDPAPIRRLLSDDVYIHRGIGTGAVVKYGDQEIGPSGAIPDGIAR